MNEKATSHLFWNTYILPALDSIDPICLESASRADERQQFQI